MTGDGRRFVTVGAGTTASVVALLYALYEALPRQASCPHLHILDGVWGMPAARLGRPTTTRCCWLLVAAAALLVLVLVRRRLADETVRTRLILPTTAVVAETQSCRYSVENREAAHCSQPEVGRGSLAGVLR
jgi:hypothetical protein